MAKPVKRTVSHYAQDAVTLLAQAIRERRLAAKMTTTELSSRAGISRALLRRIENADPNSGIGAYLETAAILGVPLFEDDRQGLATRVRRGEEKLALLPKAVRTPRSAVKDDF